MSFTISMNELTRTHNECQLEESLRGENFSPVESLVAKAILINKVLWGISARLYPTNLPSDKDEMVEYVREATRKIDELVRYSQKVLTDLASTTGISKARFVEIRHYIYSRETEM